jgi:DNA-binding MarR family transcriptional regulator
MAESTPSADQRILPLISHLARVGRRAADTCAPGSLRPGQLLALTMLGERGPVTQHQLGAALRLDASNVVGLLNDLEDLGLVTRRRDPADRRRHIVALSRAGASELTRTTARLREVEDELLKALTPDERVTLRDLLVRAVGVTAPACEQAPCDQAPCDQAPCDQAPCEPAPCDQAPGAEPDGPASGA